MRLNCRFPIAVFPFVCSEQLLLSPPHLQKPITWANWFRTWWNPVSPPCTLSRLIPPHFLTSNSCLSLTEKLEIFRTSRYEAEIYPWAENAALDWQESGTGWFQPLSHPPLPQPALNLAPWFQPSVRRRPQSIARWKRKKSEGGFIRRWSVALLMPGRFCTLNQSRRWWAKGRRWEVNSDLCNFDPKAKCLLVFSEGAMKSTKSEVKSQKVRYAVLLLLFPSFRWRGICFEKLFFTQMRLTFVNDLLVMSRIDTRPSSAAFSFFSSSSSFLVTFLWLNLLPCEIIASKIATKVLSNSSRKVLLFHKRSRNFVETSINFLRSYL